MVDTPLSESVYLMAELARRDPNIKLNDIVDQMQAETALANWSEGISFDRQQAQETLLQQHPHLKNSVGLP